MKIGKEPLTLEDVKVLQGLGVVLNGQQGQAHFQKREESVPQGMKRLPSGRIIPWTPIHEIGW